MDQDHVVAPSSCCLVDNGEKCTEPAGNAVYNKRIQRNVAHKNLNLYVKPEVSNSCFIINIFTYVIYFLMSVPMVTLFKY